ncbi:DUF397 domain-containing protein [Streptomyces sp. ISL-12]|uniref:DUF397 domain-containing protein n=1 Tax=Streptomyces sp. ISL-12 TaxID=2819177 RepID=UPI001BE53F67|nr:DUF397 domain-containing protein [Streptomyces sp. ISL-12]MBT2411621.1 DUF397 domain-containing protein [Streptomyces sp. ISL-12]
MSLKPSGYDHCGFTWIKSSYSSADGPSCVEMATAPAHILIRDSKDPHRGHLTVTPTTWATFLPYASDH